MRQKIWGMKKGLLILAVVASVFYVCRPGQVLAAAGPEPDPAVLGRRAALNVLERNPGYDSFLSLVVGRADLTYQMVCARYGTLIFADAVHEPELRDRLAKKFEPFLAGTLKPRKGHVDYNVFGIVPFELYRQTGNAGYLDLAKKLADDEFKKPGPGGLSTYTRFWVDDMYMVGSLQVQAYKSLKQPVYLDRAFTQLLAYCDKLQKPNGLFYHTPDSQFFWGRGNGWAAASMTELLLAAPEDHPMRPEILKAYQRMMKGLLEHQDPAGLWHQLIDVPESYIESSSSGMFIFAMATGVRMGWLPADPYRAAVLKAWQALPGYLDADGNVREVCVGTSALNNKSYYLARPRKVGDLHGQAGFLWAATAVYLLNKEPGK